MLGMGAPGPGFVPRSSEWGQSAIFPLHALILKPYFREGGRGKYQSRARLPHYLFLSTGKKQQGSRQEGGGASEEGKVGHP